MILLLNIYLQKRPDDVKLFEELSWQRKWYIIIIG